MGLSQLIAAMSQEDNLNGAAGSHFILFFIYCTVPGSRDPSSVFLFSISSLWIGVSDRALLRALGLGLLYDVGLAPRPSLIESF